MKSVAIYVARTTKIKKNNFVIEIFVLTVSKSFIMTESNRLFSLSFSPLISDENRNKELLLIMTSLFNLFYFTVDNTTKQKKILTNLDVLCKYLKFDKECDEVLVFQPTLKDKNNRNLIIIDSLISCENLPFECIQISLDEFRVMFLEVAKAYQNIVMNVTPRTRGIFAWSSYCNASSKK